MTDILAPHSGSPWLNQPASGPTERGRRIEAELERRRRLRQVYDATLPHAELCDFDAQGMDIIEGRRA